MTSSFSPPEPARRGRPSTAGRRSPPRDYRPRELRDAGLSPDKTLGQHFLTDRGVAGRIVAAAALTKADTVVEVGPGLGALTERLIEAAGRVIAVEIDVDMCRYLRTKFEGALGLEIVHADALSVLPEELLGAPGQAYGLVANLPYNVGTAIIRHFLESRLPPRWLIVTLQKEVADAMTAAPGDLSLAGIGVQVYAAARRLFTVAPGAFYPPPKVRSAVIRLDVRAEPLVPAEEQRRFFGVVRAGFSAPRKQLRNSLAQGLRAPPGEIRSTIEAAAIDPKARPADLSIDDWLRLSRRIEEPA